MTVEFSRPEFAPKTIWEKLAYFIEESSEANAAAGKTLRFGFDSRNPDLNDPTSETNREWLLRELHDVERAVQLLKEALESEEV